MTSLAVFDTPSLPDGWEGRGVIRIVDPLGKGAAWIDPTSAGLCVGFFARERAGDPWSTFLTSGAPAGVDRRGAAGCELLWIEPGGGQPIPARSTGSGWRFETRDPTSVAVAGEIGTHEILLTARCEDGVLRIEAGVSPKERVDGALGFRMHVRGAEVVSDDADTASLVLAVPGAGELHCTAGASMRAQWWERLDDSPIVRVDWMPRPDAARRDGDGTMSWLSLGAAIQEEGRRNRS